MRYVLIIILILPFIVFGQNKKDPKGKRTGHWVYFGKDRPASGYKSNVKIEEGNYINGYKDGNWIKYYPDGKTPKLQGNYLNNRPYGSYSRYQENGKLKEQGNFSYSTFNGVFIRYHPNGKIAYKSSYNSTGKESGLVQYFYPNGQVELEYNMKDGKPMGTLTRYFSDGSLKEITTFSSNGQIQKAQKYVPKKYIVQVTPPINKIIYPPTVVNPRTKGVRFNPEGHNRLYNENEAIWIDGLFKGGQLYDGKVFEYDKDGISKKVRVFKKGKYHSDGQL
jgi:antitoxin component YwqK of YwqJK toxin-antitoxin module